MKIKLKVKTNAKQAEVIEENNSLLVKVKSSPIQGKANSEIVKLLAKYYKLPLKNISIIHGQTGKNKLVEIVK